MHACAELGVPKGVRVVIHPPIDPATAGQSEAELCERQRHHHARLDYQVRLALRRRGQAVDERAEPRHVALRLRHTRGEIH